MLLLVLKLSNTLILTHSVMGTTNECTFLAIFFIFLIFHVHVHVNVSYQSLRPLSLKLFLVSLVMSGAAGHCVWLTPTSEDPAPTGFSCDRAFSRREGVWLSLCSDSPAGPSAPPSSRGNKLGRKVQ